MKKVIERLCIYKTVGGGHLIDMNYKRKWGKSVPTIRHVLVTPLLRLHNNRFPVG